MGKKHSNIYRLNLIFLILLSLIFSPLVTQLSMRVNAETTHAYRRVLLIDAGRKYFSLAELKKLSTRLLIMNIPTSIFFLQMMASVLFLTI